MKNTIVHNDDVNNAIRSYIEKEWNNVIEGVSKREMYQITSAIQRIRQYESCIAGYAMTNCDCDN